MDLVKLSKFMSLVLRHQPEKFGLMPDEEGFVPLDEFIAVLRKEFKEAGLESIKRVMDLDTDKKRFTISGNLIRANYGHSAVKVQYDLVAPPSVLYHGTNIKAFARIFKEGLKPMGRHFVHLTTDEKLARKVGGRRGEPRVVKVEADKAFGKGVKFYQPNDKFWLADDVPAEYLRVGL